MFVSDRREAALLEWRAGCRRRRMEAQDEGRRKAQRGDPLHLKGCMLYYDGKQGWLNTVSSDERSGDERSARGSGKPYRRGDLWGSVGAWFSGRWWNDAARGYIREVKRRLKARTWRTHDFRGG
jgi:hypothetical protein